MMKGHPRLVQNVTEREVHALKKRQPAPEFGVGERREQVICSGIKDFIHLRVHTIRAPAII